MVSERNSSLIVLLQKWLTYSLIVFLPSQLGRHFWPDWSFASGVRVDYFSPTIYFTDVLIFFLFATELAVWGVRFFTSSRRFSVSHNRKTIVWSLGLIFFISLNIYLSRLPEVSFYKWMKIGEVGFIGFFLYSKIRNSQLSVSKLVLLLFIPLSYESFLAVAQFIKQSSIGGLWYFLGERTFTSETLGIANASVFGQLILRPYGTFPHPNALAAFLAGGLLLGCAVFVRDFCGKKDVNRLFLRPILLFVLSISFLAVWLSLSISVLLVSSLALSVILLPSLKNRRRAPLFLLLLFPILLILSRESSNLFNIRSHLNWLAWEKFLASPLWGQGLGTSPLFLNYIPPSWGNYSLVFQPTHNIFLLILAETGLLGGLVILTAIHRVVHVFMKNRSSLVLFLFILGTGLTDHYWLTLQSTQLLFATLVAITLVTERFTSS